MEEDSPFEDQLQDAIRKRILEEIASKQQSQIVQNIYGPGGGNGSGGSRSVQEGMIDPRFNPKDYNYWVDITREDVTDPEGEKVGWKKRVKRFAEPREKMIQELFGEDQL